MTDANPITPATPTESPLVGLRKAGIAALVEVLLALLIAGERIGGEPGAYAMVAVALGYLTGNVMQKWALK